MADEERAMEMEGACLICQRPTCPGQGVCSPACATAASREIDRNVNLQRRWQRQTGRAADDHCDELLLRNGQLSSALLSFASLAPLAGPAAEASGEHPVPRAARLVSEPPVMARRA